MESWENKIIRDKIESLQQLPAGYLPDLSSKWEIIEAGLPVKKKSSLSIMVKWSVAAAAIIGICFTGITINQNKDTQNGIMSSISTPSLPVPKSIQKEHVAVIAKPAIIKKNRLSKILKQAPLSKMGVVAKQDNQPLIQDELRSNLVELTTDSAVAGTEELAVIVPQPETPKPTKRRTFQKDFNDGLLVIDTGYSKPANPQFSLKLQLRKSTVDEAQSSRRLQLKQVL